MPQRVLIGSVLAGLVVALLAALPAAALQDGGDDLEITTTGGLTEIAKGAFNADVAYNSVRNEYLVVFNADPAEPPMAANELEIFGQRLDAAGAKIGGPFRITQVGGSGSAAPAAVTPEVAYSATSDSYLVVYAADPATGGMPDDKTEIFSRPVAANGTVGAEVRISETGVNGNATDDARAPDIAWNPLSNEFIVAWHVPVLATNADNKIVVQTVDVAGTEFGSDLEVSSTEGTTGADSDTGTPAVAADPVTGRMLVAWHAEPVADAFRELEVFGQLLADDASPIGGNFRISETGPESDKEANSAETQPGIAFNPVSGEYLVTWTGDKGYAGAADNEFEVLGQRVGAAGGRLGGTIRVSSIGADGSATSSSFGYDVAFNPASEEFLAIWGGDDQSGGLVDDEHEIFGQRLSGAAAPLGANFRIGQTGVDGEAATDAARPQLAAGAGGQYLGVWDGIPGGFKLEVFGDRLFTPVVSIGDASANEGAGALAFPVTLQFPDPAGVPVTVGATTADGSALAGRDYSASTGTVTVPAGAGSASFGVPLLDDGAVEPTEQLTASLSAPVGALAGDTLAAGSILDDDVTAGRFRLRSARSSRKGVVTLTIEVPGPGRLTASATGKVPRALLSAKRRRKRRITVARKKGSPSAAGVVKMKLRPRKQARKVLKKKRKLRAGVKVVYAPREGAARRAKGKVTFRLAKKRKRR